MENEYTGIVRQYYEELYRPFINLLRSRYSDLSADTIEDLYHDVWIDVRTNILSGRVEKNTKWKAYIFKIGLFKANNISTRGIRTSSLDTFKFGDDDEKFNPLEMEVERKRMQDEEPDIYHDPELNEVLARELSYIPEPCNKVLKFYYYEGLSMKMIAEAMNYSSQDTAKVTKKRCFDKLKERVINSVRRLGIIG